MQQISTAPRWLIPTGLFFLTTVLSGPAHAERLGFKGAELGSPLSRIASDPRHECRPVRTPLGDTICGLRPKESETIAGVAVLSIHYFFEAGRLTSIQLTVAEKEHEKVVNALGAKYGAGAHSSEAVSSLSGTKHENRMWNWTRPEGSLRVQRYSGRLDRTEIRFTDENAVQRLQQRRGTKDPLLDL